MRRPDAYDTFLVESGLGDGEVPQVPKLEHVDVDAAEGQTLEIVSLANAEGANALAAGQEPNSDSQPNVLFGQNGSGRNGYVRILKRVLAV